MPRTHLENAQRLAYVQKAVSERALQYGNKASNLQELAAVCPDNIPMFCPLSNELVQKYLNIHAPDWNILWAQFQEKQGDEKAELRAEAIPILHALRELIITTFKTHPLDSVELANFLDSVKQKNATLMVRSTGEEDTVDVANPGGNESVSAVEPTISAVSAAMGIVVASYFSEKSLKQRLLRPCNNITKAAFVPVLLQQMIGEPRYGYKTSCAVTRSGVMYTGQENTRIQIAPGHGELVVNSKGLFDTFSVTGDNVVYSEVARKPYRLVPMAKGLGMKKNSQMLQDRASISQAVALRITQIGRDIEQHYGMPMDVELLYDPKEDKIFIVQARPIPGREARIIPSSVPPESIPALKAEIKEGRVKQIHAHVITPGGYAAKIITKPEQILICNTIEEALAQYLAQKDSPVQAVVVKNLAGTTSHEAAQFNAKAIPVLQIENLSKIQDQLKAQNVVLMVDQQRNQILDWTALIKDPQNARQELESLNFLKSGLFTLPLTPLTSQPVSPTSPLFAKALRHPLTAPKIAKEDRVVSLSTHIEILEALLSPDEALRALNNIRYILYKVRKSCGTQMTFFPQAMVLCEEIARSIVDPDSARTKNLELVARLKSLIYAPAHRDIFSNSIKQFMQETTSRNLARQAVDKDYFTGLDAEQSDYLTQFMKLNKLALNAKSKIKWTQFVMACVQDKSLIQQLAFVVKFYIENQFESDLINQDLQKTMPSGVSAQAALKALFDNCIKTQQEFATINLEEKRQFIHAWGQRIHEWSDPTKFDTLMRNYEQEITPLVTQLKLNSPLDLVVMAVKPEPENYEAIPGIGSHAIVIAEGSYYILNRRSKEFKRLGKSSDFLDSFTVDEGVVGHRELSDKEQNRFLKEYYDISQCEWSLFHSPEGLTAEQMLSLITTDFAYVVSAEKLYFINKKSNTCTLSNMDDAELEIVKRLLKEQYRKNKAKGQNTPIPLLKKNKLGATTILSFLGEGVLKDHHFIESSYNPTTQKAILNMVLQLTELMDNSIKALKGSPNYSPEQQDLLVSRFETLLQPYYELMSVWINAIPDYQFTKWYGKTDGFDNPTVYRLMMLRAIKSVLDSGNDEPSELNASDQISIVGAKLGSGANFYRQFVEKKYAATYEDAFSLIHQNILSALSFVRQEVARTPMDSLPEALQPLLSAFEVEFKKFQLQSIDHHFPKLALEFNLTMANHSAKFIIEYDQETQQVSLHGHIFGGNFRSRMTTLRNIIIENGIDLDVTCKKLPVFSENTLSMDFVWEFPASQLQVMARNMCLRLGNCESVLDMMLPNTYPEYEGKNLLEWEWLLKNALSRKQLDWIKKLDPTLENITGRLELPMNSYPSLAALLNASTEPKLVIFIMETFAQANSPENTQALFKLLEVVKNPALQDTNFQDAVMHSNVPAFKQAIKSLVATQDRLSPNSDAVHLVNIQQKAPLVEEFSGKFFSPCNHSPLLKKSSIEQEGYQWGFNS